MNGWLHSLVVGLTRGLWLNAGYEDIFYFLGIPEVGEKQRMEKNRESVCFNNDQLCWHTLLRWSHKNPFQPTQWIESLFIHWLKGVFFDFFLLNKCPWLSEPSLLLCLRVLLLLYVRAIKLQELSYKEWDHKYFGSGGLTGHCWHWLSHMHVTKSSNAVFK